MSAQYIFIKGAPGGTSEQFAPNIGHSTLKICFKPERWWEDGGAWRTNTFHFVRTSAVPIDVTVRLYRP